MLWKNCGCALFYSVYLQCIYYESKKVLSNIYSGGKIIWSPADFVRLPTDKEMISL